MKPAPIHFSEASLPILCVMYTTAQTHGLCKHRMLFPRLLALLVKGGLSPYHALDPFPGEGPGRATW